VSADWPPAEARDPWPSNADALIEAQNHLAAVAPALWSPPDPIGLVAGCFVCFARSAALRAPHRALTRA
jgi:hypothetical protein